MCKKPRQTRALFIFSQEFLSEILDTFKFFLHIFLSVFLQIYIAPFMIGRSSKRYVTWAACLRFCGPQHWASKWNPYRNPPVLNISDEKWLHVSILTSISGGEKSVVATRITFQPLRAANSVNQRPDWQEIACPSGLDEQESPGCGDCAMNTQTKTIDSSLRAQRTNPVSASISRIHHQNRPSKKITLPFLWPEFLENWNALFFLWFFQDSWWSLPFLCLSPLLGRWIHIGSTVWTSAFLRLQRTWSCLELGYSQAVVLGKDLNHWIVSSEMIQDFNLEISKN